MKYEQKSKKVVLLDLLSMSPYYNHYLVTALSNIRDQVFLVSTTFHLDKQYYSFNKTPRYKGIIDIINKINFRSDFVRRVLKSLEYILNLILLIIKFAIEKPAILHIQWIPLVTLCPFEVWFLKIIKLMNIKVVYTVHNILPHDTGDKYKQIYQRIYHMVDSLICHTKHASTILTQSFGINKNKIYEIPHGPLFHDVPDCVTNEKAKEMIGLESTKTYILFIGLIKPYKGIEFLLEAWKEVQEICPNTELVLAGNGKSEYLVKIRDLVKNLNIEKTVNTFFYYLSTQELALFHQATDIIVYPYENITQSGALLTGMAYGKAIIATNVGGFKDTLIHNQSALLVDYGNRRELADSIIKLINFPQERKKIGKTALQQINNNYSWKNIARKTIECYDETCKKN